MKNICQFQPSDFKEQYDELIETEEGRYLAGGEGALTNMNCSVLLSFCSILSHLSADLLTSSGTR